MELALAPNAAELEASAALFMATVKMVVVLAAGWLAIAYARSRFDP